MLLVTSQEDVSGDVVRAVMEGGFSLRHLRRCGNDLDEIYRRYFERAGDQHAADERSGKRKGA